MKRFIVTGGGTSGHINPAISIADALASHYGPKEGCEIIFTGRKEGLEGELVSKAGYELKDITAKPFPMKPSTRMVKALVANLKGKKQCKQIIKDFKPDAVIGTGGYVCAPLLEAAASMKVPVIIHEANAFPGRANRWLGRKADLVLTGFPNLEKDFPKADKVICTGNPIRANVAGTDAAACREKLGLKEGDKMVFAMGGSLGSKTINDFVIKAASEERFKDVKFVLGTGKQQSSKIAQDVVLPDNLETHEYITNPNEYMAVADVSLTRSGAVTCAETAAIGSCSVLIPYPYAAHDHQTYNASAFSDVGGCVLMKDADVVEGKLGDVLEDLLNDEPKRMSMRANAKKLAVLDCDEKIVKAIGELIGE